MNRQDLKQILSSKFDFVKWKELLLDMFKNVDFFTKTVAVDADLIKSGGQLGTIHLGDRRDIALFVFEVADHVKIERNRIGLREIGAKYVDQNIVHGALVFYHSSSQANYRLTFVSKKTVLDAAGNLITQETAPKRFTFLLGENEPCSTAAQRLIRFFNSKDIPVIADLEDAFSVERLNSEFFDGYKSQYKKFKDTLPNTRRHRDYVKKLLGRLVFLQFLQKRGWMGVPANVEGWEGGDKQYLYNLIHRYEGNDRLLSDVLEYLFFNTLNEKRNGDIADKRLGDNVKIPYLNGGLFEKDDIDRMDIDFPFEFFANLIDFFSMYNFTIDENDPDDAEVGVDPEMLGHIFENLLEDNNEKGAYYTPKEIVQYMSQESVSQYLKKHLEGEFHEAVDDLIMRNVVAEVIQNKNVAKKIDELLDCVKVCDPAIGSGAFPIGVMNVLYRAHLHLYGFSNPTKPFSPASVKKDIIQNNIYGVDIEQGAVDIARLRFWLALIVDEEEPVPLPNLDYKIVCGDSLLNRYDLDVPIKSVFVEYNQSHTGKESKMSLQKYKQLVADFTNTDDHEAKKIFRGKIEEIKNSFRFYLSKKETNSLMKLRSEVAYYNYPRFFEETAEEAAHRKNRQADLAQMEEYAKNIETNRLYSNSFEWRFEYPALLDEDGGFTGFDIIIGNPPYLRIQGLRDRDSDYADELVKKYKSATGSFDLYEMFVEQGLKLSGDNGIVNYIMPTKWTNSAFGKGLRKLLVEQTAISKIISFGDYQIFDASTYTGLQWFVKGSTQLEYYELDRSITSKDDLQQFLFSLTQENSATIEMSSLSEKQWVLTAGETSRILKEMNKQPRRIKDVFDKIFQGLATSKDDVYFLYNCEEEGKFIVGDSKQLGRRVKVEKGLVKPLLKGEDVHRYDTISTNRYVIFPYRIGNGKAVVLTEQELQTMYPEGYAYLKENESILRDREHGRLSNDNQWYKYIYPKNLVHFANEKLVAPDISMGGNFAYDIEGKFYQTTTIYGYLKKANVKESYGFWMALLNSRLCWWFLTNTGTTLANGFFRFKPDYINPFPIPSETQTEKCSFIIESLATMIQYLYNKSNKELYTHTLNERLAIHLEEIIDMVVYELYFEQHMKEQKIDVIEDLKGYKWNNNKIIAEQIKDFYQWFQQSDNMVRQKLMLLDTRSSNLLYEIHKSWRYEQN